MTTALRTRTEVRARKKPPQSARLKVILFCLMVPYILSALYVVSILWRVSVYQQRVFGRSELIPMSLSPRPYTRFPTMNTYGAFTFNININGRPLAVHKQVINGFQHAFGSALAAYELGEGASDVLFRLNEYMEAYCTPDGSRFSHYMDTKKDLHNNAVGRAIGIEARRLGLRGSTADRYIAARVLNAIQNQEVIHHWLDPSVRSLPSLEAYGCPGLPHPEEN